MYGFVTALTSRDDGPYWVILLIYRSHETRHTGFRRLTVVNGTLGSRRHSNVDVEAQKLLKPILLLSPWIRH